MGTPAFVNTGTIYFKESKDVQKAIVQILKWAKNANDRTLSSELNGDYNIREIETHGDWISFKADSVRVQNLEWQMENFKDFVKTLDGAVAFQAPLLIASDNGVYWDVEESDS
jgi:hypothetical protein